MEKVKKYLSLLFFPLICLMLFSSCWKENLDHCWQGRIQINIYAEKFQNAENEKEDVFSERIRSLHYFLYHEGVLVEKGLARDFEGLSTSAYTFERNKLPFGHYQLLLFGNTDSKQVLTGNPDDPSTLMVAYPGCENNEDYFACQYEFTLDCDCGYSGEALMQRMHGVVQYQIKNIPDNITEIEVSMNHLGTMCDANLTVCNPPFELSHRLPFDSETSNRSCTLTLGVFPTLPENKTVLNLVLYADNDYSFAVYRKQITDQAQIYPNQLLRVDVLFPENGILEDVDFGIVINPKWDGSHEGDIEIK